MYYSICAPKYHLILWWFKTVIITDFFRYVYQPYDFVIPYPNENLHSPGEQSVVVSGSLYQSWNKLKDTLFSNGQLINCPLWRHRPPNHVIIRI